MKRAVNRCKLPIALKLPKLKNSDHGRMLTRMNPSTSLNRGIFVVILQKKMVECVDDIQLLHIASVGMTHCLRA